MSAARRFQLDELTIRPGTYFNPQTEILIVVDDSPEVDHEIFETEEFDSTDWVLISDESPLDEDKRDELIEHFRVTYQPGGEVPLAGEDEVEDEEDELEGAGAVPDARTKPAVVDTGAPAQQRRAREHPRLEARVGVLRRPGHRDPVARHVRQGQRLLPVGTRKRQPAPAAGRGAAAR